MTLISITTPQKTINGLLSNPNAGRSQLPYEFLRQDYITDGIFVVGGNVEINLPEPTGDVTGDFNPGDSVFVVFNNPDYVDGVYIVIEALWSGTRTSIVIDLPHISSSSEDGYINNLTARPGYKLEARIVDTLGAPLLPLIFRFTPETDGRIFIDIGQILTNLQEFTLEPSLVYQLEYREAWRGEPEHAWIPTDNIQSIYARKQIGLLGGSNLWEHLLNILPLGILLTKFIEPMAWRGWHRTVSTIMDSEFGNRTGEPEGFFRQYEADINKTKLLLKDSTPIDDAPIRLFSWGFDTSTIFHFALIETVADDNTNLAEDIYYSMLDECPHPIMVAWVNSLGAPEQHLFSVNQEVNIEASPGLSYITTHNQDQENIHKDKNRIFSEERQTLLLIAQDLTNNQIKALAEIKTSTQVEVYLSKDGSEKIGVITRDALASGYETANARGEFRLVIEFPDNYDFFEAKNYD